MDASSVSPPHDEPTPDSRGDPGTDPGHVVARHPTRSRSTAEETPARPRLRLTLGAGIVLVLLGIATTVLVATLGPHGSAETVIPGSGSVVTSDPSGGSFAPDDADAAVTADGAGHSTSPPDGTSNTASSTTIFVHILGEVVTPGLYELREGDRAIDVVAAAGGLTDLADDAQLNLARFLSDGEQIVVPKEGEAPSPGVAVAPGSAGAGGTGTAGSPGVTPGGAINLNLATADELEDLPGVGPELAARIVDWRDANGRFKTVDDLLSVAGFGEKKLDALRDSATT
jgi:competence protein ComEA